jgi:hypothetical protein
MAGLTVEHARSLAQALAAPVDVGRLAVVRTGGGDILGGRKAAVHDGTGGAWVSYRTGVEAPDVIVETVQLGAIAGLVEGFLQALWVLMEPVA